MWPAGSVWHEAHPHVQQPVQRRRAAAAAAALAGNRAMWRPALSSRHKHMPTCRGQGRQDAVCPMCVLSVFMSVCQYRYAVQPCIVGSQGSCLNRCACCVQGSQAHGAPWHLWAAAPCGVPRGLPTCNLHDTGAARRIVQELVRFGLGRQGLGRGARVSGLCQGTRPCVSLCEVPCSLQAARSWIHQASLWSGHSPWCVASTCVASCAAGVRCGCVP